MDKEEYYKRIERINDKFKTDRVSADEEYQLVCQKNYLSTKYIEHLEQQCKKQKEVIDNTIEYINKYESIRAYYEYIDEDGYDEYNCDEDFKKELLDILNEVTNNE